MFHSFTKSSWFSFCYVQPVSNYKGWSLPISMLLKPFDIVSVYGVFVDNKLIKYQTDLEALRLIKTLYLETG